MQNKEHSMFSRTRFDLK